MGVGRRGARLGFAPPWILKLLTKKLDFSISRGKNQISSLLAVSWKKNLGKSPTGPSLQKILPTPVMSNTNFHGCEKLSRRLRPGSTWLRSCLTLLTMSDSALRLCAARLCSFYDVTKP